MKRIIFLVIVANQIYANQQTLNFLCAENMNLKSRISQLEKLCDAQRAVIFDLATQRNIKNRASVDSLQQTSTIVVNDDNYMLRCTIGALMGLGVIVLCLGVGH